MDTIRASIRQVISAIGDSEAPNGKSDTEPAPASTEELPEQVGELSEADLVKLLNQGTRSEVERVVGQLVGRPKIPRELATELVSPLVTRMEQSGPAVARLCCRGLTAIAREHPVLLRPHLRSVERFFDSHQIRAAETAGNLLLPVVEASPEFAPVVYSGLVNHHGPVRTVTLRVLVEIGHRHPVVLAPIWPFFAAEVTDPTVDRRVLAQAIEIVADEEPAILEEVGTTVLDWLPDPDEDLERAVVAIFLGHRPASEELVEHLTHVLLARLARADRSEREAVIKQLVEILADWPSTHATISEALALRTENELALLQARIDESALPANHTAPLEQLLETASESSSAVSPAN